MIDQTDAEKESRLRDSYCICNARGIHFTMRFLPSDLLKAPVTSINRRKNIRNDVLIECASRFEMFIYMKMFVQLSRQRVPFSGKRKRGPLMPGAQ